MSLRLFGHISIATVVLGAFTFGMFLVATWSVTEVLIDEPELRVQAVPPPELSARSWLVLDVETGTEVASHNAEQVLPIASITKLFSAAAFMELTQLRGTTTITWGDVATEGRAGKLQAGEVYPYHELVHASLIESSNDAASTMVRAESSVLTRMNEYPGEVGLSQTSFTDASGLSAGNQSTAYELARLTRHLWQQEPHIFAVSNQEQMIGTYTGWVNNNPFIAMAGYQGGKHGFTYEAGRTATAVFTEELRGGSRDFIYVVLGSDDLTTDVAQLQSHVRATVQFN